jgi:amidase
LRLVEVDKFRWAMQRFMADYDVMICPVAATPARKHGETHRQILDYSYSMYYNLTGWPGVVVPCGISPEGLPKIAQPHKQ